MATVKYYSNVDGKVKSGTREIDDIFNFEDVVSDIFNSRDARKLLNPPRVNNKHCNNSFPPSNACVDPETKEIKIVMAATDVKDEEFRVDLEDDMIVVTFDRKREEDHLIYDWKGLRFVKDEVVKFKFDQRYHDASTTEVKLERGCLFITMQPREEVKPIRKTIAGGLKKETNTD